MATFIVQSMVSFDIAICLYWILDEQLELVDRRPLLNLTFVEHRNDSIVYRQIIELIVVFSCSFEVFS